MTARLLEVEFPRAVRLPAGAVPAIPPPEALAHAARADGERHGLSARRVRVHLSGVRGVERVEGDGVVLVEDLRVEGAAGANLLVGPRSSRRECFTPAGSLLESVQIPDALPGIVVQWSVPGAAGAGGGAAGGASGPPLRLTARLLPGVEAPGDADREIRLHRAPGLLWVGRGEAGVLLCVPGGEALPDVRLRDGAVALGWDLPAGSPQEPLTLLLQAAPPDAVWTAPTALAGVAAHARRGEAAAWGEGEPGLVVESGVEEMEAGVRWARAWIRDRLLTRPGEAPGMHAPAAPGRPGGGPAPGTRGVSLPGDVAPWLLPGSEASWVVMGAAASGDREAGRGALSALAWHSPGVALLSALALARWTAWTGDARPLAEHAARLAALLGSGRGVMEVEAGVVAAVRTAVAAAGEAAEATGVSVPDLRVLDAPGSPGTVASEGPGGSRRLPVVGAPVPTLPPLVFRPGREGVPVAERLREALEVREALGALARAPHLLEPTAGAVVLHGLAAGLLGATPDAAYGRLALSPFFPPNWSRFRVRGIRAGEGALDLGYERQGTRVRWTLGPQEGSVPLTVVFEPWQPVTGIREVRVDGAPAELDVVEEGGWSRVKIQIPADGVRVVELAGTTEGRP